MNPENTYHAPLHDALQILEPLGYRLFGLYDQTHEWQTGEPKLRRLNAVFISTKTATAT